MQLLKSPTTSTKHLQESVNRYRTHAEGQVDTFDPN